MKNIVVNLLLVLLLFVGVNAQTFKIVPNESKKRIDVLIDGKLFTSYRWDERYKRPILFPIIAANGATVTRGFPFETRNGETVDHPHQVGSAFSHGDVNGIDFWNNSTFRTPAETAKMGTIVHRKILKIKNGNNLGEFVTESDWLMPDGNKILNERTRYVFQISGNLRLIERETELTALSEKVVFGDNKEGVFALRLARELEQPNDKPLKITDENGRISETKNTQNVTGEFINSEGLKGDNIWGTAGKWAAVSGKIGGENVTVAIFDHPKNPNFPSYMMVRGYGLLALNSFGQKAYQPNLAERKFILEPKKSVKFRYGLLIFSEKVPPETIEREYQKFNKK